MPTLTGCNVMQGCTTVASLEGDKCVLSEGTFTAHQPGMALLGSQTADLNRFELAGVTLAQQVCV